MGPVFHLRPRPAPILCGQLKKFSDVFSFFYPCQMLFLSLLVFSTMLGEKREKPGVREANGEPRDARQSAGQLWPVAAAVLRVTRDPNRDPRGTPYPPFDLRCFSSFCCSAECGLADGRFGRTDGRSGSRVARREGADPRRGSRTCPGAAVHARFPAEVCLTASRSSAAVCRVAASAGVDLLKGLHAPTSLRECVVVVCLWSPVPERAPRLPRRDLCR